MDLSPRIVKKVDTKLKIRAKSNNRLNKSVMPDNYNINEKLLLNKRAKEINDDIRRKDVEIEERDI